MLRIDSHQHFWKFNPVKDSWITDDMSIIRRDFMPADLHAEMQDGGVFGCVAIQADQSEKETEFLLSLATGFPFIKGVVGWVDLCANDIEEKLQQQAKEKKIKGFRHILQGETNPSFMLTPAFINGVKKLRSFDLTYDILIFPGQLQYLPEFLQQHPEQKFVIDHIAKPDIKHNKTEDWAKKINLVAQFPNVWCKISGMATEAGLEALAATKFYAFFQYNLESFWCQPSNVWFRLAGMFISYNI